MLPQLKYAADRRTVAFVIIYFAATILAWIYWPDSWLLRVPIVIFLSFWSFFCAVIVHNTIHHPIFKKRGWNKVFQIAMSFTYGHSVSAFVPGHNFSHHQHTQTLKDRIRTDKMRFKINFFNQFLMFFRNAPDIMADENAFAKLMWKENRRWFWQYVLELGIVMSVKIALLIIDPVRAIFLLFLPHLYAAWGIVGTNYWQHDGTDRDHPYNHSRNFTNKALNYFAFNNGYHGMHHEDPNMHWSLLPAAHEEQIAPHIHPNLNRNSLVAFLWEAHIYPGKRVDYLGNPVVLPPKKSDDDWMSVISVKKDRHVLGTEQ